jgi:hypothetical protein
MANKEILDQLNAEKITRTTDLAALDSALDVLRILVTSWKRESDLLPRSQRKGWQSEAKTLGSAMALLSLEIASLEKRAAARPAREPITGQQPSWTDPAALDQLLHASKTQGLGQLVAGNRRCPNGDHHEPHTWVGPRDPVSNSTRWQCTPKLVTKPDDIEAFLSGATDELPTFDLSPIKMSDDDAEEFMDRFRETGGNSVTLSVMPSATLSAMLAREHGRQLQEGLQERMTRTIPSLSLPTRVIEVPTGVTAVMERLGTSLREARVHEEVDATMPDVHADPVASPFREAAPPPLRAFTRPVPPAGVGIEPYTWADLAAPADPATIPDHMSSSQLSALDTCAAQARISRYDGRPGIPLWGAVGGTAFHSAVEEIERGIFRGKETIAETASDPKELNRLWEQHFQLAIAKTIQDSGVPMTDWHASNRGKENYPWWMVEGGEMLRGYVTARVLNDDGRRVLVLPDGRPAIELELNLSLYVDLPVKVILDIVWQLPNGDLEIWDHKTKSYGMNDPDTIQLGTQAHALVELLNDIELESGQAWGNIWARYFDARKGIPTERFDARERHPIDELEMRYADADDRRRNRPAIPVRSNLCKACPVAYLCPVGSTL